jgi:CPA2 family monovalent cation:H+ antiporter-2
VEIPLLKDILIIFGLAIGVLFVCSRIRIPATVGFLLTGVLAGPHGLGLIQGVHEVEVLAEVGVVLLLFTIGMEFSLKTLLKIKKSVLLGGSLQVGLSLLAAFALSLEFGRPVREAVFIGFLIALSSTAIVLKGLQERAEIDSPHGRTSLAILIFQDMIVVPMMLLIPILAGTQGDIGPSLLLLLGKGLGIVLLVVVSAKWVVPQLLHQVARTRSRELFLLSVVVLCFAIAWFTAQAGLSLALGAFLAGLIISESDYSLQALGNILPFRDLFTSFFFVSIGMLLNVDFLLHNPGTVLPFAVLVMALKMLAAGVGTVLLGFPMRTAVLVGLTLGQVGEFSFLLAQSGAKHGFLQGDLYQLFLSVAVLTMACTPFLMAAAPRAAALALRLPMPARLKSGMTGSTGGKAPGRNDHLVIIGFGVNGRNLSRAASLAGIPHEIIEMNPETVRREKARGLTIFFGDATQETVLHHAGIEQARVAVVAISDAAATRRITELVRRLNGKIHLIARTRFLHEIAPLCELGANEVIPEEFETSVEIFTRVLKKYIVPRDEIEKFISEIRSDGYQMLRSLSARPGTVSDLGVDLPGVEVNVFRISGGSHMSGKSLAETELRKRHGVSVLAVRRGDRIIPNPDALTELQDQDIVVVLGTPEKILEAETLFRGAQETDTGEPL